MYGPAGVLQEKNLETAALGLAPMYPAYLWSDSTAPGHYGYKRASDLISGKASKLAVGFPSSRLRREDRSSIALSFWISSWDAPLFHGILQTFLSRPYTRMVCIAEPSEKALLVALREIGSMKRSLFTMDWLKSPERRRRALGRACGPHSGREGRRSQTRRPKFEKIPPVRCFAVPGLAHRPSPSGIFTLSPNHKSAKLMFCDDQYSKRIFP